MTAIMMLVMVVVIIKAVGLVVLRLSHPGSVVLAFSIYARFCHDLRRPRLKHGVERPRQISVVERVDRDGFGQERRGCDFTSLHRAENSESRIQNPEWKPNALRK
jgi:hypothetical protein